MHLGAVVADSHAALLGAKARRGARLGIGRIGLIGRGSNCHGGSAAQDMPVAAYQPIETNVLQPLDHAGEDGDTEAAGDSRFAADGSMVGWSRGEDWRRVGRVLIARLCVSQGQRVGGGWCWLIQQQQYSPYFVVVVVNTQTHARCCSTPIVHPYSYLRCTLKPRVIFSQENPPRTNSFGSR